MRVRGNAKLIYANQKKENLWQMNSKEQKITWSPKTTVWGMKIVLENAPTELQ